ncbi:hypothetical protein ACFRAQ_24385 [Nocardia sp. NPDC056611]|uniref:hypothetical protein n=1 Tax=Nocardia sp. NPDC056611 TaxID=3345877 RepID=UPI00366CFCEC
MEENVDQLIRLAEAGDRPREVLVYARSLRDLVKELSATVNDLAAGDAALQSAESSIEDLES